MDHMRGLKDRTCCVSLGTAIAPYALRLKHKKAPGEAEKGPGIMCWELSAYY
jgi:hypothetical protein